MAKSLFALFYLFYFSHAGLTPRTKGFSYVIKNMDSAKFPTIYDVTLAVNQRDSGPATISSILLGRKTVAEAYIRKFELKDVPKVQFYILAYVQFCSMNVIPLLSKPYVNGVTLTE